MSRRASVWRDRQFRLAWTAGFVNDTGDWVLMVALPVYVFTETGSGTATAVLFVCQLLIASLLGPLGGSLVDRWDLRRCVVFTNVAQAMMLLPLLAVSPDRIWPAYVAVVGQSALTQLNNPANVALIPRVVRRDQLTAANAAFAAGNSLARLVGAPLGGLLVAVDGLRAVVLVDLISFLGAAVAVWMIRTDTRPIAPAGDDGHDPHPIRTGLREIAARPVLRATLSINALAQVAQGAFVVLFVVFIVDEVGGDGTSVGVVRGTMAIGAVAGAAVITRLADRIDPFRLLALGMAGMGVVSLAFWNSPEVTTALWLYVVLFALSGVPGSAMQVGLITTIQQQSPPAVLGRVTGVLGTSNAVGAAVGSIVAGVLVDVAPLRLLLDGQAVVYLACAALVVRAGRTADAGHVANDAVVPVSR